MLMDTMVQMSDVMVRRDPALEWRGMVCVWLNTM